MTQDTLNLDDMNRLTDLHPNIMDPVTEDWQMETTVSLRETIADYLTFRTHQDLLSLMASV